MHKNYSEAELKLIEENNTSINKKVYQLPNVSIQEVIQKVCIHYANQQIIKFNSLLNID